MESFRIGDTSLDGVLEFWDRVPENPDGPIQSFSLRVSVRELTASVRVFTDYAPYPTSLFDEMARRWTGWPGELTWESFESDVVLRGRQDKSGHVSIRVELRSGWSDSDWRADATVTTDAGQLERIARQATAFFGKVPGNESIS